jgi:glutamine synthetase
MNRTQITVRDIIKRLREEEIEFVDLKFLDLFGGMQHITFPANTLDEDAFARGVNFDGSSVRGFQAISESDLILKPDPNSLFHDPFFDDPTLSLFCDILDPDGYKPYSRDPRGVAHRAERLIRSIGMADAASFGVEMEFYLFGDVRFEQAVNHGYYFIEFRGGPATRGRRAGADPSYASPERLFCCAPARFIAQSPKQDLEAHGPGRSSARDASSRSRCRRPE